MSGQEMLVSVEVMARDHEVGDDQSIRIEVLVPPMPAFGPREVNIQVRSIGLTDADGIRSLLGQIAELIEPSNLNASQTISASPEPARAKPFNPGAPK